MKNLAILKTSVISAHATMALPAAMISAVRAVAPNRSASNHPSPNADARIARWTDPTPRKHSTTPTASTTQPDISAPQQPVT